MPELQDWTIYCRRLNCEISTGWWREMEILAKLNPEQRKAVVHVDGPLLILAGAGSGKTRVITHRIAYLIKEVGVAPWNILAITFTNKAANEMKERVERLVGMEDAKDIWVSTYHAACVRILRKDIDKLGYNRNFVIVDTRDQLALIEECLKELDLDSKRYPARSLLETISNAKNKMVDARMFRENAGSYFEMIVSKVYTLYQQKLFNNNAVDFDDLLTLTNHLFHEYPDVLAFYQRKFQYILVDEYQDTNHAQYCLVNLLAKEHRNLCVVGDDDQSIYRWRGADLQNILQFENDYPEATVIKLEQNYRSTQSILEAANQIIRYNRGRKDKKLWTKNPRGENVFCYRAIDERDEAWFVAGEILRNRNIRSFRDYAVLYRTNAQSRVLEEVFMQRGIPYRVVGGLRFYERKEIKDIIAYLRLIENPADILSFKRIINTPKRGIGPATIDKIVNYARQENKPILTAIANPENIPGLTKQAKNKLQGFVNIMQELAAEKEQLEISLLLEKVLTKTNYVEELKQENTAETQARLENIKEFFTVIQEFEENNNEDKSLASFLENVALVTDIEETKDQADVVTMMTLHAAKGLEFPVVFMVGMEEGIFPHLRSLESEEEMEEERRLCYVGITRAKEKLFLTHANHRMLYGRSQYNAASCFINDLSSIVKNI